MITFTRKIFPPPPASASETVALPYELRCRTRLRVTLASGREAGIVLPRGERLNHGDFLAAEQGDVLLVLAAPEALLEATASEASALARAAYHLGNRHVPVQVVDCLTVRLPVDHVLAEMLVGLGLSVRAIDAPFAPEGGAYGQAGGALHATDHSHLIDRSAPVRIRRTVAEAAAEAVEAPAGLVDPGHGEHRSPRRIHEFSAAKDRA